jgi:hypothetical protein
MASTPYVAQDSEFLGKKTNNEAEICGLILRLAWHYPSAVTHNSCLRTSLVARYTTRSLPPLLDLDRAHRLMDPRSFPHGIDVQWVRRNCNAEADAAANAGLRACNQERRSLFYDE